MPNEIKKQVIDFVDNKSDDLWSISESLYIEPETAFKEFKSSQLLINALNNAAFHIDDKLGGLDTAFRASLDHKPGPTVAILAEYDALVGLGHACGHNLIASAAAGAGMALSANQTNLHGNIQVIGTPAEEGGGGKIILANAGVFNHIDAAMMFHPADKNMVLRKSLASSKIRIEFFGKASHAAAAPEDGINALDAMLLTFNNINAIRSTFGPKDRVAGVILKGGVAANIIPEHTVADFSIRSLTANKRDVLVNRVIGCAQSGAQSIGCKFTYKIIPGYKEIIPNQVLAQLFASNLESLGRTISIPDANERMGSTDMGDVSHLVPSIHPYIAIAPERTAGHTQAFKEYCHSDTGKSGMLDAAKALAMTVVDLFENHDLLVSAKQELISELHE